MLELSLMSFAAAAAGNSLNSIPRVRLSFLIILIFLFDISDSSFLANATKSTLVEGLPYRCLSIVYSMCSNALVA